MSLQIEFTGAKWFEDADGIHLTLDLKQKYRSAVKEFCLKMKNIIYTAVFKEYKPRSLDANAYFWALNDRYAKVTGISKEEVYRSLIRNIGGNNDTVCVPNNSVDRLVRVWKQNGLGWVTDSFESKIEGCTNVILYYGSSTYDTKQMSRLIDLMVQECRQVDIETKTPEELALLMEAWEK